MDVAYDSFLEISVVAKLVDKNSGFERYRFFCNNCTEEVFIAAANTEKQKAHFRHYDGNNNIECDKYVGKFGTKDTTKAKEKTNRIEFYFERNTGLFYFGLSFSKEKIDFFEQHEKYIRLIGSSNNKIWINNQKFSSNVIEKIPIQDFLWQYLVYDTSGVKQEYEVFKKKHPTVFKIQSDDNLSKLVQGKILYTEMKYFIVSHLGSINVTKDILEKCDGIDVEEIFSFSAIKRNFEVYSIVIKRKGQNIEQLLDSWGYSLEEKSEFVVLWPPAVQENELTKIDGNKLFVFSNFELNYFSNTNLEQKNIKKFSDKFFNLNFSFNPFQSVRVYNKNIEKIIVLSEVFSKKFDNHEGSKNEQMRIFDVPKDEKYKYYSFDSRGVSLLEKGEKIYLTPKKTIKFYKFGYLIGKIQNHREKRTDDEILIDILGNYKVVEKFEGKELFFENLNDTFKEYINKCIKSETINTTVKRFIKEGEV